MRHLRDLESRALEETVEGRWVPLVTSFPLAKAADAHRALENRETVGKVVLIT
jgi:NADPH2:quinone reductase